MTLGIIVSLAVLVAALAGVWIWYSRTIRNPPADERRDVSGIRLTSEALRRLPPPWRVVHEIGDQLPDIDHVVVGPPGIVAVQTVVGDRPDTNSVAGGPRAANGPNLAAAVANAAIVRGRLDEHLAIIGRDCRTLARVHWGAADARRPPAEEPVHGNPYVEGQRLVEWLTSLPPNDATAADPGHIDLAYRAVAMGIGRPDPLG